MAFDEFIDIMNEEDKRKMMECLISEFQLYPKETWKECQNSIKCIKYTFPVTDKVRQNLREKVSTVETVVKLTLKKDTHKIKVTMETNEESNYTPTDKVTYQKIKAYVKEKHELNVSILYIVQIKDKCGLDKERTDDPSGNKYHVPKCPPEKKLLLWKHSDILG